MRRLEEGKEKTVGGGEGRMHNQKERSSCYHRDKLPRTTYSQVWYILAEEYITNEIASGKKICESGKLAIVNHKE